MPIEMPRKLPFSVDTWSPNSKMKRHHFLTHAHKDHCSGITSHFSYPIYSTHLTKLIILHYFPQLDESLFVEIEVGMCLTIEDSDGSFKVTAFDANHCPGAVMFLFEGDFGNILHTGDCRLTPECLMYLPEKYLAKKSKEPNCPLDFLFLDCTFGKSLMKIPSKQSAIQQVTSCIWKHPDVPTVYLTCNLLGQEEILVHVSETFGSKIFVDKVIHSDFYKILQLIAPQIISEDPSSRFHLFEGFPKLYEKAKKKLSDARENMQPEPLIIRPSAQWYAHEETELTMMERKILEKSNIPVKDHFGVWHVCYSMHSSRQELEWALELLAPKWVVSTTPECRAMELNYVKKHCFNSQSSDVHVWKLLDLSVDVSPNANISPEISNGSSIEVMTIAALEESKSETPKKLANKRVLSLSPLRKKPSIILFGRARLGYHSCISGEVLKSTSGSLYDQRQAVSDKVDQKQSLPGDIVEVEELTEFKNNVEHKLSQSDYIEIEKPTEFKNNVEQKLSQSDKTEVEKLIELKNNDEQKLSQSDNIKVKKPAEGKIAVADPEINSDMSRRDMAVCETEYSSSCSSYTSYSSCTSSGSVKGFSDNVRKLYRSMNVPVPKPLPSLVELMKARKRAKR